MQNTSSQGFTTFVLGVVMVAGGVSAQTRTNHSTGIDEGQSLPAVVNVDILRHPITPKVRHLIYKAMEKMDAGDDKDAIDDLLAILAKYPESAAYIYKLLGVAYTKTDQIKAAVNAFEQAALLLPHDAITHYYLGLALVCDGDYDRARQEVQRALELDPKNPKIEERLHQIPTHQSAGN